MNCMTNSTRRTTRNNIKKYRTEQNLTQVELSEMAEITSDYLSELERGKKVPSLDTVHALATALGIQPYKLLMPDNCND